MVRKSKAAKLAESQTGSSNQSGAVLRRSGRLGKLNSPSQNGEIGAIIEINDIEDGRLNSPSQNAELDPVAEPIPGFNNEEHLLPAKKSLEEKIDDIVRCVEELNAKASRRRSQDDVPTDETNYRSLYFDSQLKIEALMKENSELSRKAEVAVAKLEAYGDVTRVWSDVLGQMKEVFMFANGHDATEATKSTKVAGANGSKATKKAKKSSSPTKIAEGNGATATRTDAKRKKTTKPNQPITEENGVFVPLTVFVKNKKAKTSKKS